MAENGREIRTERDGEPPLRALLDHGPIIAFVEDGQGRYLYVNPMMHRRLDVTVGDVREGADGVDAGDGHVLAAGESTETIRAVPLPDGTTEHWMVVRFPFAQPDGRRFVGGLAVNVTDLERARVRLADSERRYRHLVESAQGLICTHDMEGRLLTVNQAALALTGLALEEVVGRNLRDLLSDVSRKHFPLYLERIGHLGVDAGMMFVRAKNGRELAWQYRNVKVLEPGQEPYVLGHAQDVTELRDAQEQLMQLAMTDELTGLHNRRGFFAYGSKVIGEAARHQKGVVVVYVDIDGLKRVNDTFGHDAGTELIVAAADALKNTFRAADVVARLGGDEFVALAQVARGDAETITNRLNWHMGKFNASSGRPYRLAMSVGLAHVDAGSARTLEALVKEADEAMYKRKRPRPPRAES